MGQLIKYRFLQLIRQRDSMFWALAFPLIMATFFSAVILNAGVNEEEMEAIKIAVVRVDNKDDENFENLLTDMSDTISVTYMEDEEAVKKLENGEIKGIYYIDDSLALKVLNSDISTTILNAVLSGYNRDNKMLTDLISNNPAEAQKIMQSFSDNLSKEAVEEIRLGGNTLNTNVQYFFALIAMSCLYGSFLGMLNPLNLQANLSAVGARRSIASVPVIKSVIADMIAVFTVHFINILILLLYIRYIVGLSLGNKIGDLLLISFIGSLVGVSIGIMVGSLSKQSLAGKIGIILAVSMISSAIGGLMSSDLRITISEKAPWVDKINPATLIADAYYSISVYDNMERFQTNCITLLVMSIIFILIGFLAVRRKQYDSL